MIVVLVVVRTLEGVVRDCLQSPRCATNSLQHALPRSQGRNPVQILVRHTERSSRATCRVLRGAKEQPNRVEIAFIFSFYFLRLKPHTDEGRGENGEAGENPGRRALENATYCTKTGTHATASMASITPRVVVLKISIHCTAPKQTDLTLRLTGRETSTADYRHC